MSSEEILAEVREYVRVEDITEYEGLPAGPRVTDSDAIIIVEGRSDVLTLLKYGIKNAIAVEGTNVPDAVAELTRHRTVTAFLDGDRGGELILAELAQVGDIDYVAFAPAGDSVEALDHHELFAALRNKVPYDAVSGLNEPRAAIAATDGSTTPAPPASTPTTGDDSSEPRPSPAEPAAADSTAADANGTEIDDASVSEVDDTDGAEADPTTVYEHASEIIRAGTDRVRFLDADTTVLEEADASDAYDSLEGLEEPPETIVLDAILTQRLLDLAADSGVERIVARSLGQFTKRPTAVRVHAVTDIAEDPPETG